MAAVNDVLQRDGLFIFNISGLAFSHAGIEGAVRFPGAFLGALTAGNALGGVDITGLFQYIDGEISGLSRDSRDLGEGQQLNIEMPAAFHQFG